MLNPLLLWFLPLAAVPILLHLITLYRLRTVELSTFRFLMESYLQQRRRLKLLEWLLMALRTLFVLLIVLMLSRPVIDRFSGLFGGDLGRDVTIILDAGATMRLASGGSTGIQRAREAGRAVVERLSAADHVTVIRAGHGPRVVYEGFAVSREPILAAIDAVEAGLTPPDLPAALGEALGKSPHGPRVVYLVTDARKRAMGGVAAHTASRLVKPDQDVVVLNVGSAGPVTNLSLIGDPPRTARPVVGLPVLLSATVTSRGSTHPIDTRLSLILDDQQVSQQNLSLAPGQTVTRSFGLTPMRPGVLRGRFELTGDDFGDDDQYLFTLNVEPQINVLLVTGALATGAKAAEDPRLFITTALRSPLLARGGKESEEQRIAQSLSVTAVAPEQLTEKLLAGSDAAIIANLAMDPNRGKWLRQYVESGGGLLVFPGPQVSGEAYTQQLFAPQPPRGDRPAILKFAAPVGDPANEATFQPVASLDLSHPVLSAFDDPEHEYFGSVRLYQYLPVEPAAGSGAAVLMRSAAGDAVLVETKLGRGRLIVAGFAATPDLSNLPLKAEFVPLLLRAVGHLRREAEASAVASVRPHEPAPVRLSDRWGGATVNAVGPDNQSVSVEMHRSDDHHIGALLTTDRKGYYTFNVQPPSSAGAGSGTRPLGFAVNLDAEQIDFTPMDRAGIVESLRPARVTYLEGTADDPVLTEQLTHKREVWRTMIWVMFAVMGLEFLLSTLAPVGPVELAGGWRGRVRRWVGRVHARVDRSVGLSEPVLHEETASQRMENANV